MSAMRDKAVKAAIESSTLTVQDDITFAVIDQYATVSVAEEAARQMLKVDVVKATADHVYVSNADFLTILTSIGL